MEKKKSKLSDSFVVGVIALVFLIVGYQTALFVYRASVMRIVSNRDDPDTVYIYQTFAEESSSINDSNLLDNHRNEVVAEPRRGNLQTTVSTVQRKPADHSSVVEAVRQSAPRRQVEFFASIPTLPRRKISDDSASLKNRLSQSSITAKRVDLIAVRKTLPNHLSCPTVYTKGWHHI